MDAVVAVSGSSPAYIAMLIEPHNLNIASKHFLNIPNAPPGNY